MKLFISFDLEGMAGITFWREISENKEQYRYYKKIVTDQIKYVCESLFKHFKLLRSITLCDSHAFGNNFLYDELPDNVDLIKGYPRRYYMMEGLDENYGGVIFLGYHVGIGKIGNMDHTYSAGIIHNIKINNKIANEFLINSYLAGEMKVPVIMAAGGNKFINHVKSYNENIETAVLKEEIGKFSAKMINMEKIKKRIDKTVSSIKSVEKYPVISVKKPIKGEIELKDTKYSEVASLIPGIKRITGRKIIFYSDTMKSFYETLMAIIFCCKGLPNL
ncbi:MAG: hypothetical protein FXF47_04650 [Candidatus Mcinerneyibacterium aminivorans]|uniref:M55 family metallopeptidase n=1 Tax=Candidatus Mcinerneyibacterium aminivorans TaxID=2703815 RepID=A0A5D0MFW0_9BACT|nr:MAG: hypothetical protein FXF47_04650 [Candidatus Mcinerneyibacterium aminivorans]